MKELAELMISDTFLIFLFLSLAIILQVVLVIPLFQFLITKGELEKKRLIYTWAILSISSGVTAGIYFRGEDLGILDFIHGIGFGIGVFAIYYSVNFTSFYFIGRIILNKNKRWTK